jgi:hypothetical protein
VRETGRPESVRPRLLPILRTRTPSGDVGQTKAETMGYPFSGGMVRTGSMWTPGAGA